MTGRQDYLAAESCFNRRQERLGELDLRELGAFVQYSQAKASHLEGTRGDLAATRRSTEALERAIKRGGGSSPGSIACAPPSTGTSRTRRG